METMETSMMNQPEQEHSVVLTERWELNTKKRKLDCKGLTLLDEIGLRPLYKIMQTNT